MKKLAIVVGLLLACSFATLASAKKTKPTPTPIPPTPTSAPTPVSTTSCPGVPSTTIQQAENEVLVAACIAGETCASNSAECKKAALQAALKQGFMTLMSTYNIGPFCAGAIVLQVSQAVVDGRISPISCPPGSGGADRQR